MLLLTINIKMEGGSIKILKLPMGFYNNIFERLKDIEDLLDKNYEGWVDYEITNIETW